MSNAGNYVPDINRDYIFMNGMFPYSVVYMSDAERDGNMDNYGFPTVYVYFLWNGYDGELYTFNELFWIPSCIPRLMERGSLFEG